MADEVIAVPAGRGIAATNVLVPSGFTGLADRPWGHMRAVCLARDPRDGEGAVLHGQLR